MHSSAPSRLLERTLPSFSRGSDVSKTILIADDNKLLLATLRQVLECQPGFVVCGEAVNGKDAIEKAQRLKPDLIVLDISMPVMNGLDAAHTLQTNDAGLTHPAVHHPQDQAFGCGGAGF